MKLELGTPRVWGSESACVGFDRKPRRLFCVIFLLSFQVLVALQSAI